jgi:hypothetical protein
MEQAGAYTAREIENKEDDLPSLLNEEMMDLLRAMDQRCAKPLSPDRSYLISSYRPPENFLLKTTEGPSPSLVGSSDSSPTKDERTEFKLTEEFTMKSRMRLTVRKAPH